MNAHDAICKKPVCAILVESGHELIDNKYHLYGESRLFCTLYIANNATT